MKRVLVVMFVAVAILAALVRQADADKIFQSTWKAPDAGPLNFAGKKVAAIVLTKNPAARAAAEDLLVQKIAARGVIAVAGNTLLSQSDLQDKEKAKSLLMAAGIAGAVILRPVVAGGVPSGPDTWQDPRYRKFMGYPNTEDVKGKRVPFYVEVLLYSLQEDKLVWAGKSATKAENVDELINTMYEGVVEALQKDGLISK